MLAIATTAMAKHQKRYRDDVFKRVSVTRDIQYGQAPADQYGEGEQLKLDLYQPKGDTATKRPVLIFAHGGGFTAGDKSSGPSAILAKEFARKGYLTASINYRLDGPSTGCTGANGVTPECYAAAIEAVHDGQAAVRWFRINAKDLGVDKRRIAIGGESGGAILACGVAVLSADPGSSGNPGPSSAVQSFVSISGGLPGGLFVDAKTAPGILFASTEDPVVPYQWSVDTRDKMASFGVPAKLTTFQSNVHVPFAQYGDVIEKQSTKFVYTQMDLIDAQGAG
jgi:dipeptidyl aminopeptidase/acylaminoacyl peptidase